MLAFDAWTWLRQAGPLVASVVALAIAVAPPIWRYWHRPRLKVRVADREPHARESRTAGDDVRRAWLRMEVVNEGRVEARRVRAVVHEWYERPDESSQWKRRDIDPSALHWVGMPHQRQGSPRHEPAVNLPRGLRDFADLIVYTRSTNEQRLDLDDSTPRGFGLQPTNNTGEFVLTVTVAAENARPVTSHVHYSLSAERRFYDVRLDKSPPADALFMGLLAMSRQLEEERQTQGQDSPP